MTDLQRELLSIARTVLDPRWWVLALVLWVTYDLVLAGKLSGDAWPPMLTLIGGALGVVAAMGSPTARSAARKALE